MGGIVNRVAAAIVLLALLGVAACGEPASRPSARTALLSAFLSPGPVLVRRESIEWGTRENFVGDAWARLHAEWPELKRELASQGFHIKSWYPIDESPLALA